MGKLFWIVKLGLIITNIFSQRLSQACHSQLGEEKKTYQSLLALADQRTTSTCWKWQEKRISYRVSRMKYSNTSTFRPF
jgi:hypothetical protein